MATILNDEQLFAEWKQEIKVMSGRIIDMRQALRAELERLGTPGNWAHITKQIGAVLLFPHPPPTHPPTHPRSAACLALPFHMLAASLSV